MSDLHEFLFDMDHKTKAEDELELYIKDYENAVRRNLKLNKVFLDSRITLFVTLFDIQQKLFKNHYSGTFDIYYGIQEHEKVMFHAYLKNISLLYSSHKLVLSGSYGAANIILRQVFEFLLIGKYASVTKNNQWANNWFESYQFNVYDRIIKLLAKPKKENLHNYWIITCRQTHATSSSHQIGLSFKNNREQTFLSYNFILLLLRCNYHLISSCILNNRLRYRSEYYGDHKKENIVARASAKKIIKEIESIFLKPGTDLMKDYRSNWIFKK